MSSFFSSLFASTDSNFLGCHDLDLGGPRHFFLMFVTIGNPSGHDLNIRGLGCGLGYSFWRSSQLWSWLQVPMILLVGVLVATVSNPPRYGLSCSY